MKNFLVKIFFTNFIFVDLKVNNIENHVLVFEIIGNKIYMDFKKKNMEEALEDKNYLYRILNIIMDNKVENDIIIYNTFEELIKDFPYYKIEQGTLTSFLIETEDDFLISKLKEILPKTYMTSIGKKFYFLKCRIKKLIQKYLKKGGQDVNGEQINSEI